MQAQPTHEDANLILRLYELRREPRMREARDWFARNFKATNLKEFQEECPMGSDANAYVRMLNSYWEMVASFVNSGVLNRDLFFQSGHEMLFFWERAKPVLMEQREFMKNPHVAANLEKLAAEYMYHMSEGAPEWAERFKQMVQSVAAR
jgi:hypothetical protein